jgi:diguanylate cyclase (GGDEF)-like protein/PAS domain S-box-containing protein
VNNQALVVKVNRRVRIILMISILYLVGIMVWIGITDRFHRLTYQDWILLGPHMVVLCCILLYVLFGYRRESIMILGMEQQLADNDQMLHSLFECNPQAIAVINRKGQFIKANTAARQLSGYSVEELHRASFEKVILDNERKKVGVYVQQAFKGVPQTFESVFLHKEGYRIDLNATVVPVYGLSGVRALVCILQDITNSKRALERIKFMAYYDDMTGIPNRRFFREHLESALHLASHNKSTLAVFFLDIDRFKLFNDSFGHDVGNMLLMQVAERLMHCVSAHDGIARMEGDEFAIFYTDAGKIEDIGQLALRIYEQLEQPFECQGYNLHITLSIGISVNTNREIDADEMMKHADLALSKAKEMGRNTFQFYTDSMERGTLNRLTLETDLRAAIQRDEFELHYQPQVDITTGEVVGMEGLIRWNHPSKGVVMPDAFISTIEENGMIIPIGERVIELACRQNAAWQHAGLPKFPISVNLSFKQFLHPSIVERIRDILHETGLEPAYLELELTENVTLDDNYAEVVLSRLKKLGVKICIDDFGTGYSSLHYLKRFPISRLKIDRSFVRDIMIDQNDAQIVQTIIAMARHLRIDVIAEGVETKEQLDFLKAHNCMEIQGYYFSRPLAVQGIEAWMKDRQ